MAVPKPPGVIATMLDTGEIFSLVAGPSRVVGPITPSDTRMATQYNWRLAMVLVPTGKMLKPLSGTSPTLFIVCEAPAGHAVAGEVLYAPDVNVLVERPNEVQV